MKNDREELEAFKARLSITAVAERLGIAVVRGKIRCPYNKRHAHGDRTPSVSVSEDKGLFRCWVCDDVRGDVFNLVQLVRGVSFVETLEWLRMEFGAAHAASPNSPMSVGHRNITAPPRSRPPSAEESAAQLREVEAEIPPFFREKIVLSFLKLLKPVDNTPAARWLARRKIFKKTWDMARLRFIDDYHRVNRELLALHSLEDLQSAGLYNDKGHLRYYKHPLIMPYLDEEHRPHYFQARAIDSAQQPKELNLRGTVPFPYHKEALNGEPGWVYLCEGVVDTLTALGKGFTAVGIPGVRSFKPEWISLFKNKKVVLCLDNDEAGRLGTEHLTEMFTGAGIDVARLELPEGQDVNEWFGGRR